MRTMAAIPQLPPTVAPVNSSARTAAAGFAVALAIATITSAGFAASTPAVTDAATLLRMSIEAPKTVSYIGQIETIRFSSNRAIATIMKVEHRAPALTRSWYVAPESIFGDYDITRSNATFHFDVHRNVVVQSRSPKLENAVLSANNVERVMQNYRALFEGTETVADRAALSVVLVNKFTGERAMRLWIDRETHLVLKKEDYHANGSVASRTRFDAVRYTTEIPEGIFATDLPAKFTLVGGTDVASMNSDVERAIGLAGFRPYEPKNLPQGFAMIGGDVSNVSGVKTLHLLYSDGLRSISLFENATGAAADFGSLHPRPIPFEGHQGQYVEDGPTTLLTWKEKNLYFALVGDLMRNELVEIAKSVVPN